MATPVAREYVELVGDFKRWESELKSNVKKSVDGVKKDIDSIGTNTSRNLEDVSKRHRSFFGGIASQAKGVAGVVAGLFALDKATEFFKSSIEDAREAQKATAQTNAVIKSTGGVARVTSKDVEELANSIARKTGIDDEQIRSNENMLLTFTNIRNETGKGNDIFTKATKTVTDMSVALGEDGKSAAIQLGKALNDPIRGVTALRRVGVSFTAAQQKQIKTLVDTGHTMEAQKLVLGELNKEFGGSAAAQATAGDKMRVAWKEFKEFIGKAVLPILDTLANFIVASVIPALQSFAGWVSIHIVPYLKQFGDFVIKSVVPALVTLGTYILSRLVPVVRQIVTWFVTKWYPALFKLYRLLYTDLMPIFRSWGKYFLNTILPVIIKVAKEIGGGFVTAIRSTTKFLSEHKTTVQAVAVALLTMYGTIKLIAIAQKLWAIATGIVTAAQTALNVAMDANPIGLIIIAVAALAAGLIYAYKHSETFRNIVNGAFRAVKMIALDFVRFFTNDIPAAFNVVLDFVKRWGPLVIAAIFPFLGIPLLIWQHWSVVKRYLDTFVGWFTHAFSLIGRYAVDFANMIVNFFTKTIPNALKDAIPFIKKWGLLILGAILPILLIPGLIVAFWSPIKTFLTGLGKKIQGLIKGASSWLTSTGTDIASGLWTGISNRWKDIQNWFNGISTRFTNFFRGVTNWLATIGKNLFNGLWNGISTRWKDIQNWFNGIGTRFTNFFRGVTNWLTNIGKNLFSGLWNGISHRWTDIANWLNGIDTRIGNFFRGILTWLTTRGRDLFSGLWNGISNRWGDIANWFSGLGTRFKNFFIGVTGWLTSRGKDLLSSLWNGISARWGDIAHWFSGMKDRVFHLIFGISTWLVGKGGALVSGLWKGMKKVWNDVKDWFKSLSKKILGYLGINSPPSWAIDAGHWIMKGVLKGLGRGAHNVKAFFTNTAKSLGASASAIKSWISDNDPFNESIRGHGTPAQGFATSASAQQAQDYARTLLKQFGWSMNEFGALIALWNGESGWNNLAQNPKSTAFGIAQFLDSTWGNFTYPKTSDYKKQVYDGLEYIGGVYGSPTAALNAWLSRNPHWYEKGAWRVPETELAMVHKNEMIIPAKPAESIRQNSSANIPAIGTSIDYDRLERIFERASSRAFNGSKIAFDANGVATLITRKQNSTAARGSRL